MEWNGMDSQKSSIGRARHMAHPPHMVAIRRPSSKTKGLQGSKVNKKKCMGGGHPTNTNDIAKV